MGYSAAQYQRAITTISYFLSPEEKISNQGYLVFDELFV